MSDAAPIHFLPWVRRGLATQIENVAVAGLASEVTTSAVIDLSVRGDETDVEPVSPRNVELYGPGHVTRLAGRAIAKRSPVHGSQDVEPNYFAFVEFSSPDLPWRFTPAAADASDRLQPWLALVVVEDREGISLDSYPNRLPVLRVDEAADELPPPDEAWAWAHVQVQHELPDGLAAAFDADPSAFTARVMCPRRLDADKNWLACLVPTFEAGRLAGLGQTGSAATGLAWAATGPAELPVYDSWTFRSGPRGDFESLARRLEPRVLPDTVGVRDLHVSDIGPGIDPIPEGVVSYQGALVAPTIEPKTLSRDVGNHLAAQLRDAANAPLDRSATPEPGADYDPLTHDPVVAASAYGRAQLPQTPVPEGRARPVWFGQLNTRAPHRVVAGLGAEVVREHQEELMDVAWDEARGLDDVNRRLTEARLALESTAPLEEKVKALSDTELLQRANHSLRQVLSGTDRTAFAELSQSALPTGLASAAFRRLARPNSGLAARIGSGDPAGTVTSTFLADPLGAIGAYRNVVAPAGADIEADEDDGDPLVSELGAGLTKHLSIAGSVVHMGNVEILRSFEGVYSTPGVTLAEVAGMTVTERSGSGGGAGASGGSAGSVASVTEAVGGSMMRSIVVNPAITFERATPILEAIRSSTRVVEFEEPDLEARATVEYVAPADVALIAELRDAIDPHVAITGALRAQVMAPQDAWTEELPARMWAGPTIGIPMYERLRGLSAEYLVPGVGDIPDDTVGVMLANDAFVESFLVGANHELSREFLWREFPARLTGTWLHQFWNGPKADIPDIAAFTGAARLGQQDGSGQSEVVLLLKGAFPRRYPDVLVYAVEAAWKGTEPQHPRVERDRGTLHSPVFAGELQPGTVFYGFELEERAARGSRQKNRHPGYFFVLEERPRGPRFGLDVGLAPQKGTAPDTWSDLSWDHVTDPSAAPASHVRVGATSWLAAAGSMPGNGGDDSWGTNSAAMARITLQRPMRLLVHADAMLPAPEVG